MKNPQIIISEGDVVGNKGAMAMVDCIVNGVRKKYPNAIIYVTTKFLKSGSYEYDKSIILLNDSGQNIDIPLLKVWIWWLLKKLGVKTNIVKNDKVLSIYNSSDLIVSASGISFIDNFGTRTIYHYSKYLQIPIFLNKKVIKFTQSIGPFNSVYNKIMAKLCLKQSYRIFARGSNSAKHLNEIGVYRNVETYPDIAVTMESEEIHEMKDYFREHNGKTIIGISPNRVCKMLDEKERYVPALKRMVSHILNNYEDVQLLLIPHTIEKSLLNKNDDLSICNELISDYTNDSRISIADTLDLTAEQTKWMISKCDFFIGSRFHALIAATSSCVPSIAIGWHWKYEEMMKWVNLSDNLINYWDLTDNNLIEIFEKNFEMRAEVKNSLEEVIPIVKKKAMTAIDKINEVLDGND